MDNFSTFIIYFNSVLWNSFDIKKFLGRLNEQSILPFFFIFIFFKLAQEADILFYSFQEH